MAGVRIVTDSSCDLTQSEAEGLGIEIVPLSIRFGGDEFTDRRDLTVEDFYKRLIASSELPETAAPSPGSFEVAFTNAREAGADAVVCLCISSQLSATMQSALTAAKAFDGLMPVHVLDSRTITSGLGTLVTEAARVAGDGGDAPAVLAHLESLIPRTRVFGTLNTLEYLKKGGRIGGARAMLGSMLSIKPIVDISSGAVEEAGKARTRKKAFQWIFDRLREDAAKGPIEHLAVVHGEAPDIDDFLTMLSADFPRDQIRVGTIGAVIGTHGGPEIVGVTWLAPTS